MATHRELRDGNAGNGSRSPAHVSQRLRLQKPQIAANIYLYLQDVTCFRYASSNRVKRIKKPEITNRDANQAKAAAMRAEAEEQSLLYEGKRFESVAQSLSARG